ncbi:hypothetical protein BKA56DRAFT_596911 [Ilyonectria sp. MPI-CAGE-AT-0026]|nr:hypothetical protein BKA56DRAFT_596911 [Ilyonectria sp. MPI-CAGE-AT-0026]
MESAMVLANTNPGQDDVCMTGHTETPELPSTRGNIGFSWELRESPRSDSQGQDEPQQAIPAPPGFCSVFSYQGARWVDSLVGDDSFSNAMSRLTVPGQPLHQPFKLLHAPSHAFPPRQIVADCVNGYLSKFNPESPLFQREAITALLDRFLEGEDSLEMSGWAAVNMMLAFAKFSGCRTQQVIQCDQHFQNALKSLPALLINEPDILRIGVLLCIVQYLIYSSELKPAAVILGSTIQLILLAGYQDTSRTHQSPAEILQQRRLFWQAYILDADLALRLRKAPVLAATSLISLPDVRPSDGCGVLVLDDGSTMNFLRERVALAKIQSRIYSLLYSSQSPSQVTPDQTYGIITILDQELQEWKANLPELIKPQKPLTNCDTTRLTCLTVLHYTYFQLVIAIHSMTFMAVLGYDTQEQRRRAVPSVALCVRAARASTSLLNYEHCSYPFAVSLLHQVSWSIDILFINILQNKATSYTHRDLGLIEKVIKLYERFDADHANLTPYRICCVLHKVALRAVHNALYEVQLPKDAVVACRRADTASQTPAAPLSTSFSKVGAEDGAPPEPNNAPDYTQQTPKETWLPYQLPDVVPEWTAPMALQAEFWQDFSTWTDIPHDYFNFPDFDNEGGE